MKANILTKTLPKSRDSVAALVDEGSRYLYRGNGRVFCSSTSNLEESKTLLRGIGRVFALEKVGKRFLCLSFDDGLCLREVGSLRQRRVYRLAEACPKSACLAVFDSHIYVVWRGAEGQSQLRAVSGGKLQPVVNVDTVEQLVAVEEGLFGVNGTGLVRVFPLGGTEQRLPVGENCLVKHPRWGFCCLTWQPGGAALTVSTVLPFLRPLLQLPLPPAAHSSNPVHAVEGESLWIGVRGGGLEFRAYCIEVDSTGLLVVRLCERVELTALNTSVTLSAGTGFAAVLEQSTSAGLCMMTVLKKKEKGEKTEGS